MPEQSNRFCSQCGTSIRAYAKFCSACGTPVQKSEIAVEQTRMTAPPSTPIPQAPPPQPKKSGGLRGCVIVACVLVGGVIVLAIIGTPPASHPTSPAASATSGPSTASATPATAPAAVATPTPEPKATPTLALEPTSTPIRLLYIGEVGELRADVEGYPIPVCPTKEANNELSKALLHNDDEGFAKIMSTGRVLLITQGTKARKIGIHKDADGLHFNEVQILEGKYRGRKGFVNNDFVRPSDQLKEKAR
jgi:hypothetical protein